MKTPLLVLALACVSVSCGRSIVASDGGTEGTGGGSGGGTAGGTGGGTAGGAGGSGGGGGVGGGTGGTGGGMAGGAGGSGGGGGLGGGTGGSGGGSAAACSTLDRQGCQARPDCLTTLCQGCTCTPTFNQCRAAGESELACPLLGCAQPQCCSTQAQCNGGQSCNPPGSATGCGACSNDTSDCVTDTDCSTSTTGKICKPVRCSCTGSLACQDGCTTNADCQADGDVCNPSTRRCGPPSCSATLACPSYFDCVQGVCQRKTCTTDTHCPFAYCVTGGCYGGRGTCQYPVP